MPAISAPRLKNITLLLNRIEQQFGIQLECFSIDHLRAVVEHYTAKRSLILHRLGETEALKKTDYAKAVMISETARLILREIDPRPLKKRKKKRGISK